MASKNSERELKFILDRFDNGKVVLSYDGQELVVPKRCISREAQEGDVLVTEVLLESEFTRRREDIAKALLEEILKGE